MPVTASKGTKRRPTSEQRLCNDQKGFSSRQRYLEKQSFPGVSEHVLVLHGGQASPAFVGIGHRGWHSFLSSQAAVDQAEGKEQGATPPHHDASSIGSVRVARRTGRILWTARDRRRRRGKGRCGGFLEGGRRKGRRRGSRDYVLVDWPRGGLPVGLDDGVSCPAACPLGFSHALPPARLEL